MGSLNAVDAGERLAFDLRIEAAGLGPGDEDRTVFAALLSIGGQALTYGVAEIGGGRLDLRRSAVLARGEEYTVRVFLDRPAAPIEAALCNDASDSAYFARIGPVRDDVTLSLASMTPMAPPFAEFCRAFPWPCNADDSPCVSAAGDLSWIVGRQGATGERGALVGLGDIDYDGDVDMRDATYFSECQVQYFPSGSGGSNCFPLR